jgi:hypothetical protein
MAETYHYTGSFGEDKALGVMHLELSRMPRATARANRTHSASTVRIFARGVVVRNNNLLQRHCLWGEEPTPLVSSPESKP